MERDKKDLAAMWLEKKVKEVNDRPPWAVHVALLLDRLGIGYWSDNWERRLFMNIGKRITISLANTVDSQYRIFALVDGNGYDYPLASYEVDMSTHVEEYLRQLLWHLIMLPYIADEDSRVDVTALYVRSILEVSADKGTLKIVYDVTDLGEKRTGIVYTMSTRLSSLQENGPYGVGDILIRSNTSGEVSRVKSAYPISDRMLLGII